MLVTKKDGSQRLCVDYLHLNAVTVKDAFPLLRVDDSLAGSRWFSTLDLASGYWQSGNGCEHPRKGSICNSKQLVQMECDAIRPL